MSNKLKACVCLLTAALVLTLAAGCEKNKPTLKSGSWEKLLGGRPTLPIFLKLAPSGGVQAVLANQESKGRSRYQLFDDDGESLTALLSNQNDPIRSVVGDNHGNLYLAGREAASKYNQAGRLIWTRRLKGVNKMAITNDGRVYFANTGRGLTIDVGMLDRDGRLKWRRTYKGPVVAGFDGTKVVAVTVDDQANLLVAGASFTGVAPGGLYQYDIVVLKYNPTGKRLWSFRYDPPWPHADSPAAIFALKNGSIYIAGNGSPQPTEPDKLNQDSEFLALSLSADGRQKWAARFHQPDRPRNYVKGAAVDRDNNLIISGDARPAGPKKTATLFSTIKFSRSGTLLWRAAFSGKETASGAGDNSVAGVAVDPSANSYVLGTVSTGKTTGDGEGYDFATVKYDRDGRRRWVKFFDGPGEDYNDPYHAGNTDQPQAILADDWGNVYAGGLTARKPVRLKSDQPRSQYVLIKYRP